MLEIAGRGGARIRKDAGLVPMRGALGSAMLYHGLQKLRMGREQTGVVFESMGVRNGRFWGFATGVAETAAGVLAIAGVLTRPAALAVLVTQGVAIAKVHARKGFDNMKGGFEYNVALMSMAAALLIAGPGRFSTHELLEHAADRRTRKTRSFLSRLVRLVK